MAVRSGDPCPCGHYFTVLNSIDGTNSRTQFLGCRKCGHRPEGNKRVLKADEPTPRFCRRECVST